MSGSSCRRVGHDECSWLAFTCSAGHAHGRRVLLLQARRLSTRCHRQARPSGPPRPYRRYAGFRELFRLSTLRESVAVVCPISLDSAGVSGMRRARHPRPELAYLGRPLSLDTWTDFCRRNGRDATQASARACEAISDRDVARTEVSATDRLADRRDFVFDERLQEAKRAWTMHLVWLGVRFSTWVRLRIASRPMKRTGFAEKRATNSGRRSGFARSTRLRVRRERRHRAQARW